MGKDENEIFRIVQNVHINKQDENTHDYDTIHTS